jgi:hypothetical protein
MSKSVEDLCDDTVHEILSDPAWYGKGSHTGFYRELVKRVHAALSIQQEADAKDGALKHAAIQVYRALNACAMFMVNVEGENSEESAAIDALVEQAGGALLLLESAINPKDIAMAPPTDSEEK